MTFSQLQPAYRDDEAADRFTGRRYDSPAREPRAYRIAVCGPCLEGDATPYLRLSWLVGWMAVCPQHQTVLIERCRHCRASLRVARFVNVASFGPPICTRCAGGLLDDRYVPAHPAVLRMQAALMGAKSNGVTELDGIGRLTWKELVALADVLIGTVWTELTLAEQEEIFLSYTSDPLTRSRADDAIYDCRHGSLQFFAWLTGDWPDSPGASVGRSLLTRWLTADRNRLCRHLRAPSADPWSAGPSNFESPIQQRLRVLAGVP
jgi:TniQ